MGAEAERISVLVVEDEALVRMNIAEELGERGFSVIEAANAAEAIGCLSSQTVTVLFTDIDLPGEMDGLALAHVARHRWPPIKVIVTSGLRPASPSDLPKGGRFFRKPYNASSLALAITELTSVSQGRAGTG